LLGYVAFSEDMQTRTWVFVGTQANDQDPTTELISEEDLMDDAEVDTMVREAITASVGDNQFLHSKIDAWSNNIVEGCLKRLAALNKPFKYVVTCNLTQKAGAGLHAASCTRWNEKTDGKLTVQWENNTMIILVTVYWWVTALQAQQLALGLYVCMFPPSATTLFLTNVSVPCWRRLAI
jgi:dynein light chain Tctex-type 1